MLRMSFSGPDTMSNVWSQRDLVRLSMSKHGSHEGLKAFLADKMKKKRGRKADADAVKVLSLGTDLGGGLKNRLYFVINN